MILVAGATGFLGSDICRRLVERGEQVRALVRSTSDPAAVARLRELGAGIVVGDLKEPATLAAACDGADAVVTTVTSTRSRQAGDSVEATDGQGQRNLVEAARRSGVRRYVYVSYSVDIGTDDPLTLAKRSVERAVRDSGMTYTILRPSYFMEVWLGPHLGFDWPDAKATIYGAGEARVSWISMGDVAEFAVRALAEPSAENATLELGGPEALGPLEVVRIFEEEGGRRFEVQHVPVEALREKRASASNPLEASFAALMLACAAGNPIAMEETLRTFPVRLRSVRDYARDAVRQIAAEPPAM